MTWAILAVRCGQEGLISPWPARPLGIDPAPLQQPLLGGGGGGGGWLRWAFSQASFLVSELSSFRSAGVVVLFPSDPWWLPTLSSLLSVPRSLFTLFSLPLPSLSLLSSPEWVVQRGGSRGGLSGSLPHSGHQVSSDPSLPCFPPFRVGTPRGFLHKGRYPDSDHGQTKSTEGSPASGGRGYRPGRLVPHREAVGRCCVSRRSFQIPGRFPRQAL